MMTILGNRALVQPVPQPQVAPSGLHLVYADTNNMQYRVLSVGPGRKLKDGTILPPEIKPGDRILIHAFQHDQFTFEDGTKIIDAAAVLAVIG